MCTSLLQADGDDDDDSDADDDISTSEEDVDDDAASSEQSGSEQLQSQDEPLCLHDAIQKALGQMTSNCATKITNAVQSNKPLGDSERCLCYLQVDKSVADDMKCRTMKAKTHTLAQEYSSCADGARAYAKENDICALPDLTPYLNQMPQACQDKLYNAMETNQPLPDAERCECYLYIEEEDSKDLQCHSMPMKKLTIAEEYQNCKPEESEEAA